MLPFPLFLATKYLKPKRTFVSIVMVISVVGVILGIAILIIVMSVMTGFDAMWREKILDFKPHITVSGYSGVIKNEERACQTLEKLNGITGVAPSVETRVLMKYRNRTVAPVVLGIDPQRADSVSKVHDYIDAGTFDLSGDSIVVGIDLAVQLGLGIGDKVLLYSSLNVISPDELYLPEELTVTGIFNMGMRDFDSGFVITSLEKTREMLGMEEGAHALYVMTDDPFRFDEYARKVNEALGHGFRVQTWKEIDSLLFEALTKEKGMMGALLGIISIVAIFCVTNTLIVITYQKTNEIGLLKALGVPSWKIMFTFLILGWIQCLAGTLLGIGVAYLVLTNLVRIFGVLAMIGMNPFPKEIYGLSQIPWLWSWSDVGRISIWVWCFSTVTSMIPAARALWLNPVEALRHE